MKAEDLRTLKLIEEAWEDVEKGRYKSYHKEAFLKELKKWQRSSSSLPLSSKKTSRK